MLWSKEMRQELLKECPTMGKKIFIFNHIEKNKN